jgi:hypothetical protein
MVAAAVSRSSLQIAVVLVLLLAATPVAASRARTAACSWKVVKTGSLRNGALAGVTAISSDDVWTVGSRYLTNDDERPLILHWDGGRWQTIEGAKTGYDSHLGGVSAAANNDVWAVGYLDDRARTLVEHWDGKMWSIVSSPNPGGAFNLLNAVAAVSSDDVWAVGETAGINGPFRPLVEHWDGHAWTVAASPKARGGLSAVTAIGADDAWAVGGNFNDDEVRAVALHWDGTSWKVALNSRSDRGLFGVDGTASNAVWAVGTNFNRALLARWNGKTLAASTGARNVVLTSIAATSPREAWAVGLRFGSNDTTADFSQHWDGHAWSISPSSRTTDGELDGVAASSAQDVWAVGNLIKHYTCS